MTTRRWTNKEVLRHMHGDVIYRGTQFWALSTLGKKVRLGWSANQVRRRLVKINWMGKTFWVHKKIYTRLRHVEEMILRSEKKYHHRHWRPHSVETFCWRKVRGGSSLSNHSWAIALDIDPGSNGMGSTLTNIPPHVVNAFRRYGFRWGGSYHNRPDPMHFEA